MRRGRRRPRRFRGHRSPAPTGLCGPGPALPSPRRSDRRTTYRHWPGPVRPSPGRGGPPPPGRAGPRSRLFLSLSLFLPGLPFSIALVAFHRPYSILDLDLAGAGLLEAFRVASGEFFREADIVRVAADDLGGLVAGCDRFRLWKISPESPQSQPTSGSARAPWRRPPGAAGSTRPHKRAASWSGGAGGD